MHHSVHAYADGSPLAAFFIKHTLALLMRTKNPQEVMSLVATVLEPLIATDPLVFAAVMERALTHGDSEELQKEAFQKEVTQKSMALQACSFFSVLHSLSRRVYVYIMFFLNAYVPF